jgi:hypothetical protein
MAATTTTTATAGAHHSSTAVTTTTATSSTIKPTAVRGRGTRGRARKVAAPLPTSSSTDIDLGQANFQHYLLQEIRSLRSGHAQLVQELLSMRMQNRSIVGELDYLKVLQCLCCACSLYRVVHWPFAAGVCHCVGL